jgi:hypothetical protein
MKTKLSLTNLILLSLTLLLVGQAEPVAVKPLGQGPPTCPDYFINIDPKGLTETVKM